MVKEYEMERKGRFVILGVPTPREGEETNIAQQSNHQGLWVWREFHQILGG